LAIDSFKKNLKRPATGENAKLVHVWFSSIKKGIKQTREVNGENNNDQANETFTLIL
jgi:hypothetical protein